MLALTEGSGRSRMPTSEQGPLIREVSGRKCISAVEMETLFLGENSKATDHLGISGDGARVNSDFLNIE